MVNLKIHLTMIPQHRPPPAPMMEEPPSKRIKTEESLIPEDMFLARNPSPVTFNVSCSLGLGSRRD
jgi:hypothetical protein